MIEKCKECKHRKCRCTNQTVFRADVSKCRIALDETETDAITSGRADFVVAFGGYDFKCIPCKDGLLFTPLLGDKFSKTNPYALGPALGIGLQDQIKFLAYSGSVDLPSDGGVVAFNWILSGKQLGVDANPFNGAVSNPHADLRLACFGAVTLNTNNATTFNWLGTDEIIYASIGRPSGYESFFGLYASYTYAFPIIKRDKSVDPLDDFHLLQTIYDGGEESVTFVADGIPALKVTQAGFYRTEANTFIYKDGKWVSVSNPGRFMILNHGGNNPLVPLAFTAPQGGLTFLDFLDAYTIADMAPCLDVALVRSEASVYRTAPDGESTFFYNNPRTMSGLEAKFLYDCPLSSDPTVVSSCIPPGIRLFRQGALLKLKDYHVDIISRQPYPLYQSV